MLKKLVLLLGLFTGVVVSTVDITTTIVTKTVTKHPITTKTRYTTITKIPTTTVYKTKACDGSDTTTSRIPVTTVNLYPTQSSSDGSDSPEHCLKIFNKFRVSQNLAPFKLASQPDIGCANRAAAYDAKAGYHTSFYARMCPTARAQCECQRGVGGGGLEACINAYIAEGPPGTVGAYPQENHGHWNIIVGSWTYVACGTDGNGFYTHNFS